MNEDNERPAEGSRRELPIEGEHAISNLATYHMLTSLVVPRPIAWISTTSSQGVDNLAPHSFFTVACRNPPIVQFTSVGYNDTIKNIVDTNEFVINSSPASLFEKINSTGTDYPRFMSEFDEVGLGREASKTVRVPRVAESPSAIECRLNRIVKLGDSWVVMGDVLHISVREDVLEIKGERVHPLIERLAPLARLGRNEWGETTSVRSIERIPFERPTAPAHGKMGAF
ncbi:flavin reductase family protein [Pseudarthrobacter sp. Y6]|uniref:flavin reductase family protein n=1 Tax=Pseudarthrobacter sp. Y6 TaxID=3418422 RepID=UPI003CED3F00